MEDSDGVKEKAVFNTITLSFVWFPRLMVKGYDFSRFAFLQISPDEEDFDPRMLDQVRSKLKKRKMGNEEKDDLDEKMVKDPSTKRLVH